MVLLRRAALALVVVCSLWRAAFADRVDDLARSLLQDPSYKVRVQAALVLGKLADARAVPALIQALKDPDESVRGVAATSLGKVGDSSATSALQAATRDPSDFVKNQAKASLEKLASAGTPTPVAEAKGARYFIAIGFAQGKSPEGLKLVRDSLTRELRKLPGVTLDVAGSESPSTTVLQQKKLDGYIVDGSIQRLSVSQSGGSATIDCDVKAFVATYPQKSIKVMTSAGASLQTGVSSVESGKRDCLAAASEALRDDVGKFLTTLR